MNDYIKLIICLLSSFFLCFVLCKLHIRYLNFVPKDQQEVIEINPTHKFKSCGGIDFIISTLVVYLLININNIDNKSFYILIFTLIYYGLIGLIDDLIKIYCKDHNGLSGYIRLLLEIIGVFIILNITSIRLVEFISINNSYLYIGGFAFIYVVLLVLGCINSVNITDGLDGLVTITYILAICPFLYISLIQHSFVIASFIICILGSLLAYLCFNFNPSKLIMGDVGSISLGAVLAVVSILLNKEILLLISGLIYIVEVLSVIIQVSYFKLTKGKRIFKMAPLHYHFIKKGMNSSNVVLIFTIFGIILSILATVIGVIL